MNGKDWFSVGVRIIGLLSFARGAGDLAYVGLAYLNLLSTSVLSNTANANLIYGLFYFFAGLYMLRGAPLIVNFAFPNEPIKEVLKTIE